jgi:hypothetical protein
MPFQWRKGVKRFLEAAYNNMGGFGITNAGFTLSSYRATSFDGAITQLIPGATSTFSVTSEGAAAMCLGSSTCYGFVYQPTLTGYGGYFFGEPDATSTIQALTTTTKTSTMPNGATLTEPANVMYLKKGYEMFKQVRLKSLAPRVASTTGSISINVGKFKFYMGQNPVVLSAAAATGGFDNVFNSSTSYYTHTSLRETPNAIFVKPILADSYTVSTPSSNKDSDAVQWVLEVSMDGVTWKVLDDRTGTKAYTGLPESRNVEITTKLKFYPDVVLPEPFVSGSGGAAEGFSTAAGPCLS